MADAVNTRDIAQTLATLFTELADGAPASGGFVLNAGDEGLLRSLDKVDAAAASAKTVTGSSIAAHVDHVRYGLSLMNRWSAGENNPFTDADWSASWQRTAVSADEWRTLRAALKHETGRWQLALRSPRDVQAIELSGMIGSIVHLAYHFGAMRQINQTLRGPSEPGRS
jgi:hypothetical protein